MVKEGRDIGFAKAPGRTCDDPKCPFHGELSVRGRILTGQVVSAKNTRTVTVKRELQDVNPKYKRVFKKTSKIIAHNPPCINAIEGDFVRIGECRSIAKTVAFVVIEKTMEKKDE